MARIGSQVLFVLILLGLAMATGQQLDDRSDLEQNASGVQQVPGACAASDHVLLQAKSQLHKQVSLSKAPRYQILQQGTASCPVGTDILSQLECKQAVASLGLGTKQLWVGTNAGIPKYCSYKQSGKQGHFGKGHFGGPNSGGKGRGDLAPVCKRTADGSPKVSKVVTVPGEEKDGCPCDVGVCSWAGDPHFKTFDGALTVDKKPMIVWAVHSPTVQIQLAATGAGGRTEGLAFAGDWMKGHTLVATKDKVLFDGKQILQKPGDTFVKAGVVELHHAGAGELSLDNTMLDKLANNEFHFKWMHMYNQIRRYHPYHFKLPKKVEVWVVWTDGAAVLVKMPPQQYQGGYCGNFNGDPSDDSDRPPNQEGRPKGIMLEPIKNAENLFLKDFPDIAKRSALVQDADVKGEDCDPDLKAKATKACAILHDDQPLYDDCVDDICILQDENAVQDFVGEEILKMTQAKGSVEFMGPGRCVDQAGNAFSSVPADGVNTQRKCLILLHTLSHVQGSMNLVRGTQFEGGACQLLFEESDTAEEEIRKLPQIFLSKVAKEGKGMVSSTDSEEGAVCFKMIG